MKIIKTLLLAATLTLVSATANANLYEFSLDLNNERLDASNTSGGGSFDIIPPYNPGAETIDWADLSIRILNPDGVADWVTLSFGNVSEIDAVNRRTFTLASEVTGTALGTLRQDGLLQFTVEWGGPNQSSYFLLDEAFLLVQTSPNSSNPVPDGGTTLGLLGMAMIGLEWGRRKVAARSKN